MRRAASLCSLVVGLVVCLAGCFYVDPINQRPSLDIRPESSDPVYREDTIVLHAIAADPEKQIVSFAWQVYLCDDATDSADCDAAPYFTGTAPDASFRVPAFRRDPELPNQALRVVLEGKDDHGAAAQPPQLLLMPVLDHPPVLEVRKVAAYGAVIGTPIDLFARVGDPDDTPAHVDVEWTVFSPVQTPVELTDLAVPDDLADPAHRQAGKRLVPTAIGEWDIQVVATDALGARVEQHVYVTVVPDAPPCLDVWRPIAAAEQTYPLIAPTLFQVAVARDDLDAYPPSPGDPVRGTTRFAWSLRVGSGPRQPLATTANSLALDPAAYAPGTALELRVQIFDRKNLPIACDDGDPTCAVDASNLGCIQRQTWRVEVR